MNAPFYPIVYVRGYAATQGEINATVDDPFYGFNVGSTHIRVGAPKKFVSRFFTYATPHGGIQLRSGLGFLERVRDFFGPSDLDTFGPNRMFAFLIPGRTPKAKAPSSVDPRAPGEAFDVDRVFCAFGTNAGADRVVDGAGAGSTGRSQAKKDFSSRLDGADSSPCWNRADAARGRRFPENRGLRLDRLVGPRFG